MALLAVPTVAIAEIPTVECFGFGSDWYANLQGNRACLNYSPDDPRILLDSYMDIRQSSVAEGAQWPRAFTLIGPRDSAILILNKRQCQDDYAYEANVLTQVNITPVLLAGCCKDVIG